MFGQSRSYYGMMLAHAGIAVLAVGIALVASFSEQSDLRMQPGDRKSFGGYEFVFEGIKPGAGPNYRSDTGVIQVYRDGQLYTTMQPEKSYNFV